MTAKCVFMKCRGNAVSRVLERLGTHFGAYLAALCSTVTLGFAGQPVIATLIAPENGAVRVPVRTTILWTKVPCARTYYLYIGTAPCTKDVINSGEMPNNSYLAKGLPPGVVLYATVWTVLNGEWYSSASTFRTMPEVAKLENPRGQATGVSRQCTLNWTKVQDAQAYCLYVGSDEGKADLIDSGETQSTSFIAKRLPSGRRIFARVWTKIDGIWYSSDSSFLTEQ